MTDVFTMDCGLQVAHVAGNDVSVCNEPLETTDPIDFYRRATRYKIESCSDYTGKVVKTGSGLNSLVAASQLAFAKHYPMTFTPDTVWITLLNGLATHINENAEVLRHHFVEHEGKEIIRVKRDEFVKGSPENDWAGCFEEFSHKIGEHIGKENHEMLVTEYSTTTPIAKASCEVVLMDCMKAYFDYRCSTCCGIPYFKIEGTADDYLQMKEKVEGWGKWDLDWWTESVTHMLDNFVLAAKGEADDDWFQHYFKESGGSGGPFINGWINWFFPYLENYKGDKRKNDHIGKLGDGHSWGGPTTGDYPPSYSNCPFIWEYYGKNFDYKFIAGLMAVEQLDDMSVRPRIGWATTPDEQIERQEKTYW